MERDTLNNKEVLILTVDEFFEKNERVLHNIRKREHCREVFLSVRRLSVLDEAQDFGRNRKIVVEARANNQSEMHRR